MFLNGIKAQFPSRSCPPASLQRHSEVGVLGFSFLIAVNMHCIYFTKLSAAIVGGSIHYSSHETGCGRHGER